MNNLAVREYQSPFSFLTLPAKKIPANCGGLAWCYDSFHLGGNNYYLYTCSNCPEIQIKKGIPAKETLNWGGQNV